MERLKTKKPKFRQLKRIGTMALAATIALSVPAVSNVVGKVSPLSSSVVSAAEEQTNLMNSDEITTNVHNVHNDSKEHWTHNFNNSGNMSIDGPEVDLTDLTYVVKLPDELSHLLDDEYVLDYLFGKVLNFDSAQTPFTFTGNAIDENGEEITIAKDTHKPFEHISINKDTNSIEFDFTSFYDANNLEPYVWQNVNGEYFFDTLGFTTPIIVPDERMLDNGTYELKSAYVRGNNVDLDNVSNAHSETLEVDYSTDPEPEPEVPDADKDELAALLEEAKDYDFEDYTEESYLEFSDVAEAALEVYENDEATQEEVDEAVANLEVAIADLVEVEEPEEPEEVDTSDLEELVEEANGYDAEDYTEDSFVALTAAVEAAEEVLANEEATQEEVDEAVANLEVAIAGLVEVEEPEVPEEVDTSDLEELVEEANGYDAENYTEDSFAALTAAVEAAEEVLANEETTQEEVDEAVANLEVAIADLVEVEEPEEPEEVDTSDLEELVEEANGYDADDYTEESFAVLTAAVGAAETVLENDEATQEEVDDALANLQATIDGLEAVVVEPEPEPEEKEEEVTIEDGSDDSSEEGEGNLLPKTATSSFNMILVGFLALLAGAGSLLLGRRKLN